MTSPSPLERLAGPGNVLAKEPPNAREFARLVRSGLARLKDAENEANSLDSRFDLAYSAAHSLCLAALRHHGFRPSKRYIVFQVLPDMIGLGPEVWPVLRGCPRRGEAAGPTSGRREPCHDQETTDGHCDRVTEKTKSSTRLACESRNRPED
jgi:hypothetical protein